ncbi:NUDIX hydrolase [Candidatus Sodalis sp. SoCistrobi]|uniref:NUDIX hydrolase n=1 Tax=Candidatus Sodalis sp. SoCistrobi TaxID=1922216 RepID=UPI000939E483|nr:NUDIX hydrolase [Candidatus Sodalis sp. SoCistrobi]
MSRLPDSSEAASTALTAMAQKIQALAQTGLTYAADAYDIERYEQLRDIAGALFAQLSPTDARTFISAFKQQEGYATPKVDTRALILREGKILLVKEADDSSWSLPGGWADVGDRPSMAVCREVREETGLQVEATRLLGLWDRNLHGHPPYPWHVYKLIFHCRETGGALRLSPESLDIGFFDPDSLPPLSLTRIVPEEIHTSLDIIKNAADAWFD